MLHWEKSAKLEPLTDESMVNKIIWLADKFKNLMKKTLL